jgi:hypothetical protein
MRNRTLSVILLVATLLLPRVAAAQGGGNDARFRNDVQPKGDSLANGMLIGAAIGGIVGLIVMPLTMCPPNDKECSTIVQVVIGLPFLAGGFGIGALVDGLNKQNARPAGVAFNVRW